MPRKTPVHTAGQTRLAATPVTLRHLTAGDWNPAPVARGAGGLAGAREIGELGGPPGLSFSPDSAGLRPRRHHT